MPQPVRKTSEILQEIIDSCESDQQITLKEFLGKLGTRVHALAIFVLAVAAVVAGALPGFSIITGVPILIIALQMVVGNRTVWLPDRIEQRTLSPRMIRGALARSVKPLRKIERFLRPRLLFLVHPYSIRALALVMAVLALILSLPIPGGNFLPSLGIAILSLAILERDGLLVLAAVGMIGLTGGLMIELIEQAVKHTSQFIHWLF